MSEHERIEEVVQHYKYAIQAAMETKMGTVDSVVDDWQTLFGLYLQSKLTSFSEMDEKEIREEFRFFFSRPTAKIQGLIL